MIHYVNNYNEIMCINNNNLVDRLDLIANNAGTNE